MFAFESALATLAEAPQDSDLPALHQVLADDCQHHEVMFGLVHFLESFDMNKQLSVFIEATPTLNNQAPGWTKILLCRVLNDKTSTECFRKLYQQASPPAKDAVKSALFGIQTEDAAFSSRVRQLVA